MYGLVRFVGYLALLATPAALLAQALDGPEGLHVGRLGLETGIVLLGGVTATLERKRALAVSDGSMFERGDLTDLGAVAGAAAVTYILSTSLGLGSVVASAVVGLLVGVGSPDIDVPAYCGSFVGMASPALFPSFDQLAVAGVVAGFAYVASKRAFVGFGGKLGTVAMFGCATTALLTGADYAVGSPLSTETALLAVPVATVAAVATVVLSRHRDLGTVVGSALVGLVAGVVLPAVAPGGETLAAAAFCASFAGMSADERLGSLWQFGLVGVVCGAVFVAVSGAFVGAGGKLGTIAFISCVAVSGGRELLGHRRLHRLRQLPSRR